MALRHAPAPVAAGASLHQGARDAGGAKTAVATWGLALAAAACAALALALVGPLWWQQLLLLYGALECLHYRWHLVRYAKINKRVEVSPTMAVATDSLRRFLRLEGVVHLPEFFSGWFRGAPFEAIRRGNVIEFVAYGFFCRRAVDLSPKMRAAVEHFVQAMERKWGVAFPEGHDPRLTFMAHLWEPLRAIPKPLPLHVLSELLGLANRGLLWALGFEHHRCQGFSYWLRQPRGADPQAPRPGAPPPSGGTATSPDSPSSSPAPGLSRAGSASEEELPGQASLSREQRRQEAAAEVVEEALAELSGRLSDFRPQDSGAIMELSELLAEARHSGLPHLPTTPLRLPSGASAASATESRVSPTRHDSCTSMPELDDDEGTPSPVRRHSAPAGTTSGGSQGAGDPRTLEARPIVFMHGVGFGLLPYLSFIWQMVRRCGGHPVLLLEVPHVSLRFQSRAKAVDDVARAAAALLAAQGYASACFVAHSYGTFVVSRLCQLFPAAVHSVALIDPVCMLTCYPQLLDNFVYRMPRLGQLLGSCNGFLSGARYLFSRDLIIAETFCRKFLWSELQLWPEDMPPHAVVLLSHEDDLVPSPLVAKHLAQAAPGATVMYHPTAGHGGFLGDGACQRELIGHVQRLADLPGDSRLQPQVSLKANIATMLLRCHTDLIGTLAKQPLH